MAREPEQALKQVFSAFLEVVAGIIFQLNPLHIHSIQFLNAAHSRTTSGGHWTVTLNGLNRLHRSRLSGLLNGSRLGYHSPRRTLMYRSRLSLNGLGRTQRFAMDPALTVHHNRPKYKARNNNETFHGCIFSMKIEQNPLQNFDEGYGFTKSLLTIPD
jgi:hypothetical protein